MNKNIDNDDLMVGKFLKECSTHPADKDFTERVMQRLPRSSRKIDWLTILQYVAYVLAVAVFMFFCGKELLQDILSVQGNLVTMLARIAKYGIYITIGSACVVLYTLYDIYTNERLKDF